MLLCISAFFLENLSNTSEIYLSELMHCLSEREFSESGGNYVGKMWLYLSWKYFEYMAFTRSCDS